MTDKVIVKDLRIRATVGVNRWEQAGPQVVAVDLEIAVDAAEAAKTDDISATVDYKKVAGDIRTLTARPFLPTDRDPGRGDSRADSQGSMARPGCGSRARKPWALRKARDVGVVIERTK